MTPDLTADTTGEPIKQAPSTAGMTTKVVKGSMWTLAGQVAPLAVSLITTPFVIRMLGAEGYGVLILIGLIPTYLAFADFGMSMASTKFASEAYAEGDEEKEARIVRTAALITLCSSVPVAALLLIFSGPIISLFNIPQHLTGEATLALRIASITFVITFLNGIFNTPQLARLRMDLNTFINAGSRIAGLAAMPIVLYLGFGIVGALSVLLAASLINLAGHLFFSHSLLRHLADRSIEPSAIANLWRMGSGLVVAMIAATLLMNLEKLVLAKTASVETLAYYSVAFTLASMAAMFSSAMMQSVIPAFAQLLTPEKHQQLNALFSRVLRINFVILVPMLLTLFLTAKPLITIWAGPDFGRESARPFYFLLGGVFFNIMAIVPHGLLLASGRSDALAKIYWIELIPYIGLVALLTTLFGATGAAIAWSVRVAADAIILGILAKRFNSLTKGFIADSKYEIAKVLGLLGVTLAAILVFEPSLTVSLVIVTVGAIFYALIAWSKLVEDEEKLWLGQKLSSVFNR